MVYMPPQRKKLFEEPRKLRPGVVARSGELLKVAGGRTAALGVAVGVTALYVAALFAATPYVQKIPYGILWVSILLGGAMFVLRSLAVGLKSRGFPSFAAKGVWRHAFLVAAIPVGISWADNESLRGALNPLHYWRAESLKVDSSCRDLEGWLVSSVDEVRVEMNKFEMGIASRADVGSAVESARMFKEVLENCKSEAARRRSTVESKLRALS